MRSKRSIVWLTAAAFAVALLTGSGIAWACDPQGHQVAQAGGDKDAAKPCCAEMPAGEAPCCAAKAAMHGAEAGEAPCAATAAAMAAKQSGEAPPCAAKAAEMARDGKTAPCPHAAVEGKDKKPCASKDGKPCPRSAAAQVAKAEQPVQ